MITFHKKFSFWILIVLIILLGFFLYSRHMTPMRVKGFYVQRQNMEVTVTATSTGVIKSDVNVNISAQRTGKILKLYFDEGDRVNAGDLIAELDTPEVMANLKKTEADIKEAEFNSMNARAEYERNKELFKEELVTKQQFDNVQTSLSVAEAKFEWAKAAREIAKLQYKYSFIKSTIKGVVTERPVDVGDTVATGTMVASVVDPDNLYISGPVDEADIDSISLGQTVKITMDAYLGKVFYGKVLKISPIVIGARLEAKTFEVRISIPGEDLVLKPGMSAGIEIIIGNAKDTLVVPSQTIVDKGTEKAVYVLDGGRAKKRTVETGLFNWNFTEIKKGVKEGEQVIIIPDDPGFEEGIKVKVVDLP